jgi:chromosome partitioning protein
MKTNKHMKIISLINMKVGVGKTTLSINIADCLSKRYNKRVLLIDIDPQFNSTQCLFEVDKYVEHLKEKKDTITDIFDKNTKISVSTVEGSTKVQSKELKKIEPVKIKENFWAIPGNLELYRLEITPGEGRENRIKKYLELNSSKYDFVILDTPPTPSIWMTSALIASNYYLIPAKADPISLTGIDLLENIVREKKDNLDLNIKCIGVVLTIVEHQTRVYKSAKEFLKKHKTWSKLLYSKELPKRTELAGKQLDNYILDLQDSVIKTALIGIVDELLTRIDDEN